MSSLDWRILAAAVAVLMVLGGGTLLTAQVQTDLDRGVAARQEFDPPSGSPPLKLNEFELPDDLALEIPRGAEVSPDLSQIRLPGDLDVQVPGDLDLADLDFELPQDFSLELPEGTVFSPPGLELPAGATVRLPDGREFRIPPGSGLDLPSEVVDRLLEQGVRPGVLGSARELEFAGLPPELMARLDPPRFEGNGRMTLPAGTTITLPDGRQFPFSPGMVPYAARYLLPAGSRIDLPLAGDGYGYPATFPVPRPNSPGQLADPSGASRPATPMLTEITSLPARAKKGELITVSGYVRDPAGRPVAGAPVDIFLNESKRTPGVLVGQGTSDAGGTFVIRLALPIDKPAREYQLVNHAVAFTDPAGRAWGDGWGDPPISTYASTSIQLELPARDGLGVATPIVGSLLDHTGAPVAGVTVLVSVDGVVVGRPTTSALGRFVHPHEFSAGSHVVEARFLGTSSYEASAARGTIVIDGFAIDVPPTLRAKPGDTILLAGRVLGQGAAAPEREVSIASFGSTVRLVSDGAGRFSYAFALPSTLAPGLYSVEYSLPREGVTKTQSVELNISSKISLDAPASWDADTPIPVALQLTSASGVPVAGQLVSLALTGPGGTSEAQRITDGAGGLSAAIRPLRATPGTYTLTARVAGNPYVEAQAASGTVALARFEVLWSVPSTIIRGEEAGGALTARFAGQPMAGAVIDLDFFGPVRLVTDANGRATWTTSIPRDARLGEHVVAASLADHPTRTTITTVVAVPVLEMEAPEAFAPGSPVQTTLRLRDDQGAPLRDREIRLTTVTPEGVSRALVRTDARGEWRGALNVSAPRGSNVTLTAQVDPAGPYLGADSTQAMSATAAPVVGRSWVLPLAIGLAALVGGGALYAIRRSPRRAKAAPAKAPAAAPVASARRAPDLDLMLAIPPDEPAVWGVGEPLEAIVRQRAAGSPVRLEWGTGSATLAPAEGETRTTLSFSAEGEVLVAAERVGAADMERATAAIRVVDYRKETAREFDAFLEKAQRVDASLTKRSTPREIAWTLETHLGDEAKPHLDEIALVTEITNYSHYEVGRAHYLRFVRAARALDARFDAARGG